VEARSLGPQRRALHSQRPGVGFTGIRFVSATQNIDTDESNPTAQFILHFFAAVAELEGEMIRERVTSGIRGAKAKGGGASPAASRVPA